MLLFFLPQMEEFVRIFLVIVSENRVLYEIGTRGILKTICVVNVVSQRLNITGQIIVVDERSILLNLFSCILNNEGENILTVYCIAI